MSPRPSRAHLSIILTTLYVYIIQADTLVPKHRNRKLFVVNTPVTSHNLETATAKLMLASCYKKVSPHR